MVSDPDQSDSDESDRSDISERNAENRRKGEQPVSSAEKSGKKPSKSRNARTAKEASRTVKPSDASAGQTDGESKHRSADSTVDNKATEHSSPSRTSASNTGTNTSKDPHRSLLLRCLERPERGVERLPYILSLLESDDEQTRLMATLTSCLICIQTDDDRFVEYLVDRMSDRLSEDNLSLELTTGLDYLSSKYPEQVEAQLAQLEAELDDEMPLPEVGNFTRNFYYGHKFERDGIGRHRVANSDEENPREAVPDRLRKERERLQRERNKGKKRQYTIGPEASESINPSHVSASNDIEEETVDPGKIAERSRFGELFVEGRHYRDRYSTVYETLVGRGGDEQAVELRLLGRPAETGKLRQFEEQLTAQLGYWSAIGDHTHIVDVFDWGTDPQPWLASAFTDGTLADRNRLPFEKALEVATTLAQALSHAHQNDVIHGAIDPQNIVFPGREMNDTSQSDIVMFDNVGLVHVYSTQLTSDEFIDPRYSAPEYFDDQFGAVDHVTDIYQLGATLYYLFTGEAPFAGEYDAVKTKVLEAEPPQPSDVLEDVPQPVDEILSKAMATQKIRRYETVEHLLQELRSIR